MMRDITRARAVRLQRALLVALGLAIWFVPSVSVQAMSGSAPPPNNNNNNAKNAALSQKIQQRDLKKQALDVSNRSVAQKREAVEKAKATRDKALQDVRELVPDFDPNGFKVSVENFGKTSHAMAVGKFNQAERDLSAAESDLNSASREKMRLLRELNRLNNDLTAAAFELPAERPQGNPPQVQSGPQPGQAPRLTSAGAAPPKIDRNDPDRRAAISRLRSDRLAEAESHTQPAPQPRISSPTRPKREQVYAAMPGDQASTANTNVPPPVVSRNNGVEPASQPVTSTPPNRTPPAVPRTAAARRAVAAFQGGESLPPVDYANAQTPSAQPVVSPRGPNAVVGSQLPVAAPTPAGAQLATRSNNGRPFSDAERRKAAQVELAREVALLKTAKNGGAPSGAVQQQAVEATAAQTSGTPRPVVIQAGAPGGAVATPPVIQAGAPGGAPNAGGLPPPVNQAGTQGGATTAPPITPPPRQIQIRSDYVALPPRP